MFELIKITTNENGEKVVNARDLHEFLDSKERFSKWWGKVMQYDFIENVDYTPYQMVHPQNYQELDDYVLTLDTAKEVSMVSKLPKGREARNYFIQCEKNLNSLESDFNKVVSSIYGNVRDLDTALECLNSMNNIKGSLNKEDFMLLLNEIGLIDSNNIPTDKAYKNKYMLTVNGEIMLSNFCIKHIINKYNKSESEVKMNTFESKTILEYINE